MNERLKILVTGAEEHQGLAVIRGLGLAGMPVVASGARRASLGFYSRYAVERAVYASPFHDRDQFIADILQVIRRTRPALLMPTVESTLVVLSEARDLIERHTRLAAPGRDVLEYALDKGKTLKLAQQLGVPVPRSAEGDTVDELLANAARLRFPVAVKPRGHQLHWSTANSLGFKVRYARSVQELAGILTTFSRDAAALLVQEFAPGVGRCVATVCRDGRPLALFGYTREREVPLSGGVSVLRVSTPVDERLARWTTALLGATRWQGPAMVEFKYDARTDKYTLMEVNGRFQASTALSLDAGLNLPYLAACVFTDRDPGPVAPYRVGVRERWIRGDLRALLDGLATGPSSFTLAPNGASRSRPAILGRFLRDFRPGTHYDEFKRYDWKPGLVELRGVLAMLFGWVVAPLRYATRVLVGERMSARPSARAQRSMRA